MSRLRLKNKYIFLAGILLFLSMYIYLIIDSPNIINTFIYREVPIEFSNLNDYIYTAFHFDTFVSTISDPLQLMLPIIAVIPTLHFQEELHHYFHHYLMRKNNYKKEVIKSLFLNSCIISLYIYFFYVIILVFSSFIFPISNDTLIVHDLLSGFVGQQFFFHHRLFYYFIAGIFEILLPCFVNALLAMTLSFIYQKAYMPFVITYVYYIFMSMFIPVIAEATHLVFIYYFSPVIMLYTNALSNPSIPLMLLGYTQYILIISMLLWMIFKSKERVYG